MTQYCRYETVTSKVKHLPKFQILLLLNFIMISSLPM